ncbi:CHAT domain-containing protein [Kribbella sp. NPDC058245]|uniref:CHAT domain-containing protein n=1 Tax=Kribbella sp. NPDC058245 TaxID=3346399 RepID=UPI0036EFDD5A
MSNSGWLWGVCVLAVVCYAGWLMSRMYGVTATPRVIITSARLMKAMVRIDQLIRAGETGQAMHLLDEVLTDPGINRVPAVAAGALAHRARLANAVGRFDVALQSVQSAVDIYRQMYARHRTTDNASACGEHLVLLGRVHGYLNNNSEAKRAYEEAVEVSKHGAFRQTLIRAQIELARVCLEVEEVDKAHEHVVEAQRLCDQWNMVPHRIEALSVEAEVAMARGDRGEIRRLLDVADVMMPPDSGPGLRIPLLAIRADLEHDEGNQDAELLTLFELLRNFCDLKVGHGWRQHQADLVGRTRLAESRLLQLGFDRAMAGDKEATYLYVNALGMLRESHIAQALRSGILQSDEENTGLASVIKTLLAELTDLEGPEGTVRGASAYEKLEVATSARFRQLVQLPSRRTANAVSPGNHLVQIRLIADDDQMTLYGSWQAPGLETSTFCHRMTVDEIEALRTLTGATDERSPAGREIELRASSDRWATSRQYAALNGTVGDWRNLVDCLLPPELLDELRVVDPAGPDETIPLLLIAADGQLWTFPWVALPITAHTTLSDHAAVAMVPSCSLLDETSPPTSVGGGVLAYFHGVNADGLSIERAGLRRSWELNVREVATPAELAESLADADSYAVLTMSVHGNNMAGLAHSLILDPVTGTRLSAARMMSCRFPRTVVVGACFSSDLDKRAGTDPTGIPTVMLCRGAAAVVGGLFPLADGPGSGHATAHILSNLYSQLADGIEAPWALRRATRWWRSGREPTPVSWAGLAVLTNGAFRRTGEDPPARLGR